MADLVSEALGSEGSLSIKIVGGKVQLTLSHVHASGSVSMVVEQSGDYFLDKLAAAIPGTFDDAIIAVAKQAIKAL